MYFAIECVSYGIFHRFTQTRFRFYGNRREKAEAARRFSVDRSTIYRGLVSAEDPFSTQKPGPKNMRRLDEAAVKKHVADFPDLTQNERASHFGVSASSIAYGLCKLGIIRKKTSGNHKERCDEKHQVLGKR